MVASLLDENEGVKRVHMIVRKAKQQAAARELYKGRWDAEQWVEPRCEEEEAGFKRIHEHYPHRQDYIRAERGKILEERGRKRGDGREALGKDARAWDGGGQQGSAWEQVQKEGGVSELIREAEGVQLKKKGGSGECLTDLLQGCGTIMVLYGEVGAQEQGRREGEDRGSEGVKALVEEERWEEKGVTWEGGMRTGEWEIWYRREGEQESEKWLEVKESKEEGRHLVAGRDFADREAVVAYLGEEITKEELQRREEEGIADHVMQVGAKLVDGRLHKCGGQYMNTSVWENEENNVVMMGAPYGTLRIAREGGVRKGEKLLLDYGKDYWVSLERRKLLERIWAEAEDERDSDQD